MLEFETHSVEETKEIGQRLGKILKPGDVICLSGSLGVGKTAFTGGVAQTLGVTGYITSPTFTIVNEYKGRVPLYHFDVYRVGNPDEMFEIGFDEYLEGNGVVVVEWADMIHGILPEEHIWVDIRKIPGDEPDARKITIRFSGLKNEGREGSMKL